MSDEKNNIRHIPAFPVPMIPWQNGYENVQHHGLSRRELFACHIMSAIISRVNPWAENPHALAEKAFMLADAMEKASDKGNQQ